MSIGMCPRAHGAQVAGKPATARGNATFLSRLPVAGLVLVLLASAAWVLAHARMVDTVTVRLCNRFDAGIPPEKRMPVFLDELAFDGYVWNRHAEQLGRHGAWRLRHTDFDNAPDGREVHWNSAFAWYLRGLGKLHHAIHSGDPGASLRNSIFRMSIWANAILLVPALLILSAFAARRFGPLSGAVIAVAMVGTPTFYEGFRPAYPDHHGLVSFALLGTLFGIAWAGAGWVQPADGAAFAPPRSLRQARRGMILSALCGATGLWFSALSTALALGAIGAAASLMSLLARRDPAVAAERPAALARVVFHPALWQTWALWGAGASLALYLLEYFPSHMGWRLEVNHPLYSLAWLGGGYSLALLCGWWINERKTNRFPWRKLIPPLLACLPLPALILLMGPEVYAPRDEFLWRLHRNIMEFLPLLTRIRNGALTWQAAFGWFPLLLLGVVALQFHRKLDAAAKSVLVFLATPIVLLTALQFYQVRFGLLVGPLYGALAAVLVPQIWRLAPRGAFGRAAGAGILLALGGLVFGPFLRNCSSGSWRQYRAEPGSTAVTDGQGLALLHRQMALAIREDAGGRPVVLLSSPNSSCMLAALGGFRTVGTLYWENAEGLRNAARALNAQSDEEALELFRKHGVTHVALMTWENFIAPFFRLLYPDAPAPGTHGPGSGAEAAPGSPGASFGIRALLQKNIPPFTRPLLFPKNTLTRALNQEVLMLRVVPEQTPEQARLHAARYIRAVEDNPARAESELLALAAGTAVEFEASAELGMLYLSQERLDAAFEAFDRALLSPDPALRHALNTIAIERLAGAGRFEQARQIAIRAASREDATPGTLINSAWFLCAAADPRMRDPVMAGGWIARAGAMQGANPVALAFLRAALAGAEGNYEAAAALAREAGKAAAGSEEQSGIARQMLESFGKGQPWIPAPGQ